MTKGEFTPNIQIGQLHPVRETAKDHSLNQLMRIFINNLAILKSSRFRLIRIADQVNWFCCFCRINKTPLRACWETRAPSST